MPNRILRDWTDSYTVEPLSSDAERLFSRLIMKADDYGRYHADPRLVRAGCFPLLVNLRDTDVSRWLDENRAAGTILVYEVQGRQYLSIVDFRQRVRAAVSKFPPPDGFDERWLPERNGKKAKVYAEEQLALICGHLTDKCPSSRGQLPARASTTPTPPSSSPTSQGGGVGEPELEVMDFEQVKACVMTVGIPDAFVRWVYDDWFIRRGKDGANISVPIVDYVRKRWAREETDWRAGTHKGNRKSDGKDQRSERRSKEYPQEIRAKRLL